MITINFDLDTVRSLSPRSISVTSGSKLVDTCSKHKDNLYLYFDDYKLADTIMVRNGYAFMNKAYKKWRRKVNNAIPGERFHVHSCGCAEVKMTDEELKALDGTTYKCQYAAHCIDET